VSAPAEATEDERQAPVREARETRSAALVALGILLSKLVGLLRQRVTAYFFGTSMVADVIAAAFRVGNLAQNLLGEGALSASFIPVYTKLRAEGRDDDATQFAHSALGLLAVAVLVVSLLGVLAAPWLSLLVGAGFEAEKLAMTTRLVRIVFPMAGLLVLCAWSLGVLNSHRRFFLPYAAPIVWSCAQIAALGIAGSLLLQSGEPLARALALGALVGALLELGLLMWRTRPLLGRLRLRFDYRSAPVREAMRRLPGVLLGRGVIQISGLVDTLLVSFLGTGATATFGYAQMLYLLPMSLLGTGEAAVALPEMARDTAERDEQRRHAMMRRRLGNTLTRITVLAIPAMTVLIGFGGEIISVLLRTGRFDAESTRRVAEALQIYGFALLGNASVRLFSTTFFALGNTRLPARFAVVRVIASTIVALALMRPFGVVGVVMGATSAAWLEAILLGHRLRKQLGGLGLGELPIVRLVVLAVATAAPAHGLRLVLPPAFADSFLGAFGILATAGLAFLVAAPTLKLLSLRSLLRR
jgi:putative peptidoglycan lipid II flippase